MHIPDGFLDIPTAVTTGVISVAGLGVALRHVRRTLPPQRVPLMGLAAAFVFAAQMINFPVAGGTSGHVIGGVLTAVLLGPSAAMIVLTCVLLVQCLMFADGGITTLGANVFNMALVGGVGGYGLFRLVGGRDPGLRRRLTAAMFAAWGATVLSACACAGQLALSGTARWSLVLPAMAHVHMLIGVGEGVVTGLVVAAIARSRPELIAAPAIPTRAHWRPLLAYGALISLGLAMFVSPLATSWPDGLERVAERLGFAHRALAESVVPAPLPDYGSPHFGSETIATAASGAVGTVVVFAAAVLFARVLVPRPSTRAAPPP